MQTQDITPRRRHVIEGGPRDRYHIEREPHPTPLPRHFHRLYLIVDTATSNRAEVERHWRYGDAWVRCSELNRGVRR
jgi:hypothetical protein